MITHRSTLSVWKWLVWILLLHAGVVYVPQTHAQQTQSGKPGTATQRVLAGITDRIGQTGPQIHRIIQEPKAIPQNPPVSGGARSSIRPRALSTEQTLSPLSPSNVKPDGTITTIAGNGTAEFSGDGGPATDAGLSSPQNAFVDQAGDTFIPDRDNHRIRMIDSIGDITTVAGAGTAGFSGDGGPATLAELNSPAGVFVDEFGIVYIADTGNHAIRVIDDFGDIFTIVGDGVAGFSGDGGPAFEARLNNPTGIFINHYQELLIADTNNHRIRIFDNFGDIFTYAGDGVAGFSGNDDLATSASLNNPTGIYMDGSGNGYIADKDNSRIRKVAYDTGIITTVAGTGDRDFTGDGGPAVDARLDSPRGVFGDGNGNLLIADTNNHRIRKVNDITEDGLFSQTVESKKLHVSLSITANLPSSGITTVPIKSGQATTNTFVFLDSLPVPDPALQPIIDAINGMVFIIFDEAIDQDISLHINIGNVDVTDPTNATIIPLSINGVETPVFFFLQMSVEINGIPQERFEFEDGFPMILELPVNKFTTLLENTGFGQVPEEELGLVFVDSRGFDREGIFSFTFDGTLFAEITHLSDFAGVQGSDVPLPFAPSIIEGPVVDADTSNAFVFWATDQSGNSVVVYGLTTALNDTAQTLADSSGVEDHLVEITGLQKSTRYHYQVISTDPFGQVVSSEIDTFRTSGVGELPPIISLGPFDLFTDPTFADIGWETDKRTTTTIRYDTTTTLSKRVTDNERVFEHFAFLDDLVPGKKYYYRVSSTGRGGTVSSDMLDFITPSDLDDFPPVIIAGPFVDSYSVTDTTALIGWFTDDASNSQILYWAVGSTDTMKAFDKELTTDHFLILNHLSPNTTYRYTVRSTRTSNNLSVSSEPEEFTTLLAGQFIDLQFTRPPEIAYQTDRQVIFEWETNVPSDEFIFYAPDSSGIFRIDQSFVTGRSRFTTEHRLSIGGLTPGTEYLFIITSVSSVGDFVYYPPDVVLVKPIGQGITKALVPQSGLQTSNSTGRFTTNQGPDTQAPVIINGPTVVEQTTDQIVLLWETDEVSTSEVQFGTSQDSLNSTVRDPKLVTLHRAALTNLKSNTMYTYRVTSTDPVNNGPTLSPTTVAATTTTNDTAPPAINEASILSSPSDTRAVIQWTTSEPAHTRIVFGTHQDSLNTTLTDSENISDHTITITSLMRDTNYFYRIFATDRSNNGPTPSATHTFRTSTAPDTTHPVLTNFKTAAIVKPDSTAALTVTWTTDRVATSLVEYDSVSSVGQTITDQTGKLEHSITITNLQLGQRYYYKVGSANINDLRAPPGTEISELDSVDIPTSIDTVAPTVPADLTVIPGNSAVRLRWASSTDVSGIAGYTLTREGTVLAANLPDTTYLDNTAINETAYVYTIKAVDRAGNTSNPSTPTAPVTPSSNQVPTAPTVIATGDTVSLQPILILSNASPVAGDPARATLTYGYQVATDSAFTSLITSVAGITEGNPGNPTHWQVLDTGQPDSTALESGTTYYWRARANDGAFDGLWSGYLSFVTSASKPTAVELVAMTAGAERGVAVISWTVGSSDPPLSGFHIYRSLRQDGGFDRITTALLTGKDTFEYRDAGVMVNTVYYYLIEAVDALGESTQFGPVQLRVGAPNVFALHHNAPNPFNPTTTIRFDLPDPVKVTLIVYNILGQKVIRLINNRAMEAGFHKILWHSRNEAGRATASGIYFYHIQAGDFVKTRKMLLLK